MCLSENYTDVLVLVCACLHVYLYSCITFVCMSSVFCVLCILCNVYILVSCECECEYDCDRQWTVDRAVY